MWHHMLFNKPITHLQSWRRAGELRQCSHIIYLILFVIPKVLNKKSSCRGLCLLFRTLYLQHILAFVHNRATPCFGCKYITVDSLKNYVISNCSQSPRLTGPPPDPVAEHTMVQVQIFAARGCIHYSHNDTRHLIFCIFEYPCWIINYQKKCYCLISVNLAQNNCSYKWFSSNNLSLNKVGIYEFLQ